MFLKRGLDGLDGDQRQMMLSAVTEIPAELRAQSAGTVGTGGYAAATVDELVGLARSPGPQADDARAALALLLRLQTGSAA